jgi:predicted transposase/invertase (TIGR01784 family)
MSDQPVQNPHDALFKEMFSKTETARSFFESYLPDEIRDRPDWSTLRLLPGSYTDEQLRGSESDLLYTVQLDGHPVDLYCLFEHQSTPDDWMAFRLLRYIVRIWEQFRKNNPKAKKLPPILPVVLFQGGARWKASSFMSELIDPPDELAAYQPEFRHLLVDLGNYDLATLRGDLLVRSVFLAMKMATSPSDPVLETLFDQLNEILVQRDAASMVRTLLRYLCVVDNQADIADYVRRLEHTNKPRLQEEIMTIAEKLEMKGEIRGRTEGLIEGQNEALRASTIEILEIRFHSVSYSIKAQIEQMNDTDQLRWLNRLAVQADSVTDFEHKMNAPA